MKHPETFRLHVYPSGYISEYNCNFSVHVFGLQPINVLPENTCMNSEVSILDALRNKQLITSSTQQILPGQRVYFKLHFYDFQKINDLVVNDALTLACQITIQSYVSESSSPIPAIIKEEEVVVDNSGMIVDRMRNMLTNAEEFSSDVVLICTDGNIPAHSSILAAGSEYFKPMFTHPMEEKQTGQVKMKELKKDMCFTLLEFIYTGKVEPHKMSMELLEEADKYSLLDLKEQCSRYLIKQLNCNNCVKMLLTAEKVDDKRLQKAAQQFILENTQTPNMKDGLKENVGLLLGVLMEGLSHGQ